MMKLTEEDKKNYRKEHDLGNYHWTTDAQQQLY